MTLGGRVSLKLSTATTLRFVKNFGDDMNYFECLVVFVRSVDQVIFGSQRVISLMKMLAWSGLIKS